MTRVAPPTGEDIGPTKRRRVTSARKQRIWAYWDGVCGDCRAPVHVTEGTEYDHRIPVWMHGPDDDGPNMRPLCVACHKAKTAIDKGDIAHVKRLRGETGNAPKRPIPSRGFDKTRRRRMDGTVEKVGR